MKRHNNPSQFISICFQICNNMFGPAEVALPQGSCLRWEGYRLKCGQLVLSLMDFCWCFGWSCGKLLVPSPQRSSDRSTALLGGNPWRRPTPGSGWPRLIPRQSSQRFCFGRKIWQTQKQGSKHTDFGWFCRFLVGLLLEMSARKSSSIGVIIRWVNKRCVTYEEFRGVLMDFGALNRSMGSLRTTEKTWGFFVGQIEYSLEWWPSSRRSYRPKAGR